jgi:hypothetical protein
MHVQLARCVSYVHVEKDRKTLATMQGIPLCCKGNVTVAVVFIGTIHETEGKVKVSLPKHSRVYRNA